MAVVAAVDVEVEEAIGRGGRGRGSQQRYPRTDTSKYCHTHVVYGNPSWFCNKPKEEHQWNTTFEDKMNGSTYYCE